MMGLDFFQNCFIGMFNKCKWLVKFCQKLAIWGPSYYSVPKSTCFCSDLSCKDMMVSFSCSVSFGSLISKLEHDNFSGLATPLHQSIKRRIVTEKLTEIYTQMQLHVIGCI